MTQHRDVIVIACRAINSKVSAIYCRLLDAINDRFRDRSGSNPPDLQISRCVMWCGTAENKAVQYNTGQNGTGQVQF